MVTRHLFASTLRVLYVCQVECIGSAWRLQSWYVIYTTSQSDTNHILLIIRVHLDGYRLLDRHFDPQISTALQNSS